ncbi:unnamed protein product [Mytilus edulis]|uniref:Uncharacterized protein n=1 Tax=Mytilus edulis TaxID=6550 RepID=A0A8S3QJ19_MYTED|nr:unnamed protein product [Mytilus edulis]
MSAETQDTLEDSFTTLAIDVDTTGKDFRETFKKNLKWFSNLNERWLLVVDNIDEEYLSDNTKELLLGSWKRNTRGHIIITSRREPNEVEESMVVRIEDCISLNVFEKEEGLEFLKLRTGINCDTDDDTVMTLVEELGGLPLALEQAAAHIKALNVPLVRSPFVEDSNLVEVLEDEMGCKQVIEILTRFSLFQRVHDTSLSVHRLVQEVIRDNMHLKQRCLILQHAMRMVNKALDSSQSPVDVLYDDASKGKTYKNKNTAATTRQRENIRLFSVCNTCKNEDIHDNTFVVTSGAEALRILGNHAFKEQRYLDAIRYYTDGIRSSPIENIDSRLFSNRSVAYIRIKDFTHAFYDANRCIDIASDNWKGYCWKAYAISGLIENESFPPTMEAMGLASACIASYKHPPCLLLYDMKISYPIINYQMVERPECLQQDIMSLTDRPFTTLMLRKGQYKFNELLMTTKKYSGRWYR